MKWNGKGDITDQTTHRTQNQAEMRDEERIKQWIMKTYFLLAADSDGSNWGSQTWPDMIIRTPCTSLILYRTPFTPLLHSNLFYREREQLFPSSREAFNREDENIWRKYNLKMIHQINSLLLFLPCLLQDWVSTVNNLVQERWEEESDFNFH